MALPIPKDAVHGIAFIIKLQNASIDELVTALEGASRSLDFDAMAEHIKKNVPSVPSDQLTSILDTLYSLYHIREFSGVRSNRFIDDLIDGIHDISENIDLEDIDTASLKSKFEKLLGISTLYIISKSSRLQCDGERLFFEAKILSDIRPVFDADPNIIPSAAVITHTLKITYHQGNEHKEFHVVLNFNDLDSLSDTIERAIMKDQTLRALLKQSNLSDLGV